MGTNPHNLSAYVQENLEILDQEYADDELTLKGYAKRRLNLLKDYMLPDVEDFANNLWKDGKYECLGDYLSAFLSGNHKPNDTFEIPTLLFNESETISSLWTFNETSEINSGESNTVNTSLSNGKRLVLTDFANEKLNKRRRTLSTESVYSSCEEIIEGNDVNSYKEERFEETLKRIDEITFKQSRECEETSERNDENSLRNEREYQEILEINNPFDLHKGRECEENSERNDENSLRNERGIQEILEESENEFEKLSVHSESTTEFPCNLIQRCDSNEQLSTRECRVILEKLDINKLKRGYQENPVSIIENDLEKERDCQDVMERLDENDSEKEKEDEEFIEINCGSDSETERGYQENPVSIIENDLEKERDCQDVMERLDENDSEKEKECQENSERNDENSLRNERGYQEILEKNNPFDLHKGRGIQGILQGSENEFEKLRECRVILEKLDINKLKRGYQENPIAIIENDLEKERECQENSEGNDENSLRNERGIQEILEGSENEFEKLRECRVVLEKLDINRLKRGYQENPVSIIENDLEKERDCQDVMERLDENDSEKEKEDEEYIEIGSGSDSETERGSQEVIERTNGNNLVKRRSASLCKFCLQKEKDTKLFIGDPPNAVNEKSILQNPKLNIIENLAAAEEKCMLKMTNFSIYDKKFHLCPIDSELIEKDKKLFISGVVKCIDSDDPSPEDGVAACQIGPITQWWIAGFNVGEKCCIGVSTEYGDYYLMSPSSHYSSIWSTIEEKSFYCKVVLECLIDNPDTSYGELLGRIQTAELPNRSIRLNEDGLLSHAQFIVSQIQSYDDEADPDESIILIGRCMQHFINLTGVTLKKKRRQAESNQVLRLQQRKAVTTPLVHSFFQSYFSNELENSAGKIRRKNYCNICEGCQKPACGKCQKCLIGNGKSRQCIDRRCQNIPYEDSEDSEASESEPDINEMDWRRDSYVNERRAYFTSESKKSTVNWLGNSHFHSKKKYYSSVLINANKISTGDYVFVSMPSNRVPKAVAKIIYMYESHNGTKVFHGHWLMRGSSTVLGEASHPQELFLIDDCEDLELQYITKKCQIIHKPPPMNWHELGGHEIEDDLKDNCYFFQKWYHPIHGRFEDPPSEYLEETSNKSVNYCASCKRINDKKQLLIPYNGNVIGFTSSGCKLYSSFELNGEKYLVNDCIFVDPSELKLSFRPQKPVKQLIQKMINEDLYPEYYRKFVRKRQYCVSEPFRIGCIVKILQGSTSNEMLLKIKLFYRPENTHQVSQKTAKADLNLLYWSDEEAIISSSKIQGKCIVSYGGNIKGPIEEYSLKGSNRFYFWKAFNTETVAFEEPHEMAKNLGRKEAREVNQNCIKKKLRAMDVFSGCGGLSQGLHESDVCDTLWAIEQHEPAAKAFKLNNPRTTVLTDDCNKLLKDIKEGRTHTKLGQKLPQKGDIDLLCGGPPCQGFSQLNRFTSRQYSMFKNSLIVTYLSYCDYFRPRFFILENVRSIFLVKKHAILKLALASLVRMGYQCTFGILQAGQYGVAQIRRRAFILAAAPGEKLPKFPDPIHSFIVHPLNNSIIIDENKFTTDVSWVSSAPLRSATVRDILSDLPAISNGSKRDIMNYDQKPQTHFQRMIRGNAVTLRDHICKEMNPLIVARIHHIPSGSDCDWRDLPNIVVQLSNGLFTKKLKYSYHDKKNGRSSTGALRGVCPCVDGKTACCRDSRETFTLIPWSLVHTANRHSCWDGCYGRLDWDGFCVTICTNPEPMGGKVGQVFHPDQDRVISVRECARLQGFKDSFQFYGTIFDRHRQIGNAVPPPLAYSLGLEIKKCL